MDSDNADGWAFFEQQRAKEQAELKDAQDKSSNADYDFY